MPVITAGSKFLPRLNGYIYEQQGLCSRLGISIYALPALLLIFLLLHRSVRSRPTRRPVFGQPTGTNITWTSRAPLSRTLPDTTAVPDSWVRLGQGQGHLAKEANRTISRGEASGTALAGLGGPCDGVRMEEEERAKGTRTPVGSRSRGVSTDWGDGPGLSSGLPFPNPPFPAAEQGDHVRTSPSPATTLARGNVGGPAGTAEEGQDSMDHDAFGGSPGVRSTTSVLGHHMTDDEHILYGVDGPFGTGTGAGRQSSNPRRLDLNFSRPPTPPMTASTLAGHPAYGFQQSAFGGQDNITSVTSSGSDSFGKVDTVGSTSVRSSTSDTGRGNYSKSNLIPSAPASGRRRADISSDDAISPSSYPSTSPFLPPPPPTTDHHFDPSVIMFPGPGPVADGGVRMVPAHNHDEAGAVDVHGAFDDSSEGWRRHTRVYGGGTCLACAAARDGGFYGARVRPEDRR